MKRVLLVCCLLISTVRAVEDPDAAKMAELAKAYPLKTCLVSGDDLTEMGKPYDFLYKQTLDGKEKVTLLRFCCKPCVRTFKKEPEKYLKILEEARAQAAAQALAPKQP